MKSRRVRLLLLATVLLLWVGAAFTKLASHPVVRCYLVRWSDLDQIAPNLYVAPDMPAAQRQTLLSSIADAREHVATVYGETTADPVIIAGHTMAVMNVYGGSADNRAGRAYFTPIAAYIVLGPSGIGDLDVLAHEIAHAEWTTRIGYWHRSKVPNWFDEGLAVQFDNRYSEAEWQRRTDDGKTAPDLDQMPIIQHDGWLGYATAKHEVSRWLDIVGQKGFWTLVEAIRSGADFQETYRAIEQSFTTGSSVGCRNLAGDTHRTYAVCAKGTTSKGE